MSMRVAFYGNTANNFFAVARAIRRASDIDAHLFIDSDAAWGQLPEREDPALARGYPDWIHKGPYHSMLSRFWPGKSPIVKELETFDVIMVSGGGVRLAPFVERPFIFYVTGWDLTVAPFPVRFLTRSPGVVKKLGALLGGFWQRRGIKAVAQLWSQPFSPFATAAERLRVEPSRIVPRYFPIMIDTDVYRPDPAARESRDPQIRQLVDNHDFIVFHPTRMMLNESPEYMETGQWKGNDRLFEGFAKFVAANPTARPVLALIEHAPSPDMVKAKALVRRLGIEKHVVWLKGPHAHGFDRVALVAFYAAADVVVDEFGIGWFGSIVVEGLSTGKPVLCHVDAEVMKQLYPWHPILSPRTPDEIAACLGDLWRDPEARRKLGERGREWAVEFHSIGKVGAKYVREVAGLAESMHSSPSHAAVGRPA